MYSAYEREIIKCYANRAEIGSQRVFNTAIGSQRVFNTAIGCKDSLSEISSLSKLIIN